MQGQKVFHEVAVMAHIADGIFYHGRSSIVSYLVSVGGSKMARVDLFGLGSWALVCIFALLRYPCTSTMMFGLIPI